jgi:hypothetical protein
MGSISSFIRFAPKPVERMNSEGFNISSMFFQAYVCYFGLDIEMKAERYHEQNNRG